MTADGQTASARLSDVRARLGLKSTGFRLGTLRLDPPAQAKGASPIVQLTGVARQVEGATIERRTADGSWVTAKRLSPAADGTFAVKLRASGTTVLRLSADGVSGPPLTVRVTA
jgi:hypothetical protein